MQRAPKVHALCLKIQTMGAEKLGPLCVNKWSSVRENRDKIL